MAVVVRVVICRVVVWMRLNVPLVIIMIMVMVILVVMVMIILKNLKIPASIQDHQKNI